MDDPSSIENSDEGNESDEEYSVGEKENENKWNINPKDEKLYWYKELIDRYIYVPNICPKCKQNTFRINEKTSLDLLNPLYLSCSNKKCKYKSNLRKYSFFRLHKNIPASVIHYIMYLFIVVKINATQIEKSLKQKYKYAPSYVTITNILFNLRRVITDHLKYKYKIKQIGGSPDKNISVAIDESLWVHINNQKMWLIGAIETKSRKLRCDFVRHRTSANLNIFVTNHIEPGTHIITDGFSSYAFLDNEDVSVWTHEAHSHARGDWGSGSSSTSHIEHTWAHLIEQVKLIYGNIKSYNWIYFFKEAEFRLNICKKKDDEKLKIFENILKEIFELHDYEFYDVEEIIAFDNYDN